MDVEKRAGWGVTIRRVSNHCRDRRKEKGSEEGVQEFSVAQIAKLQAANRL